jgi:putative pyoverdin transport system ATP-binding/permease protein
MDIVYGHLRDLIEGSKELQMNAKRAAFFVDEVITPAARRFRHLFVQSMTTYTAVSVAGIAMCYVVIGVPLFLTHPQLPRGDAALTTTTLILLFLIRPVTEMISVLPFLRQAAISLDKIRQLDGALTSDRGRAEGHDPFVDPSAVLLEMRGVVHHYSEVDNDRRFKLGPIDLAIRRGETLFITGGNGSGKTTLAMLLLGLYEPAFGSISLNGAAVTPSNVEYYRQYFAAVFSDFHLFEHLVGTEPSNLAARATHYIKAFDMASKVQVVAGKLSTLRLSGGQRKRLALMSSYLEDRPIYLFDEWAADQDPIFKGVFYNELLPDLKARGKTVLVITHDDAYFSGADRIVKLVDGGLHTVGLRANAVQHSAAGASA